MKSLWRTGLGICIAGVLLTGCGKAAEPSEDTPWNHGYNAILETEDGYYYNRSANSFNYYADSMPDYYLVGNNLQYFEKESGISIQLCNKPECQHKGGEDCEATYRNIRTVNTQLYDGSLYILGMDYDVNFESNMVSINLYKAALDGSSMDKVGTVIQGDNLNGDLISAPSARDGFLIHKGCAYIPYYLRFGQASKTYIGGGLAKMNLKTGETEILFEAKTVSSDFPILEAGVGDYVYFRGNRSFKGFRYVISEDRVEETKAYANAENEETGEMEKREFNVMWRAFSKDRNYQFTCQGDDPKDSYISFAAYDAVTGEVKPEEYIITDISVGVYDECSLVCYEDKLMLTVADMAYWYSRTGEKLAEIQSPVPKEGYGYDEDACQFKISMDKLYAIIRERDSRFYPHDYVVYSCPLKELFEGKGSWTESFRMKNTPEIILPNILGLE